MKEVMNYVCAVLTIAYELCIFLCDILDEKHPYIAFEIYRKANICIHWHVVISDKYNLGLWMPGK